MFGADSCHLFHKMGKKEEKRRMSGRGGGGQKPKVEKYTFSQFQHQEQQQHCRTHCGTRIGRTQSTMENARCIKPCFSWNREKSFEFDSHTLLTKVLSHFYHFSNAIHKPCARHWLYIAHGIITVPHNNNQWTVTKHTCTPRTIWRYWHFFNGKYASVLKIDV